MLFLSILNAFRTPIQTRVTCNEQNEQYASLLPQMLFTQQAHLQHFFLGTHYRRSGKHDVIFYSRPLLSPYNYECRGALSVLRFADYAVFFFPSTRF